MLTNGFCESGPRVTKIMLSGKTFKCRLVKIKYYMRLVNSLNCKPGFAYSSLFAFVVLIVWYCSSSWEFSQFCSLKTFGNWLQIALYIKQTNKQKAWVPTTFLCGKHWFAIQTKICFPSFSQHCLLFYWDFHLSSSCFACCTYWRIVKRAQKRCYIYLICTDKCSEMLQSLHITVKKMGVHLN